MFLPSHFSISAFKFDGNFTGHMLPKDVINKIYSENAMPTAAMLMEEYAGLDLKIYNKGISGNKVYQLAERWDKDCLELRPDVLSILIGVHASLAGAQLMAEAFRMASTNPARLYHLDDRGTLEPGRRADIILFQIIDNELVIRKTLVSGKLVYEDTEFFKK